MSRQSEAPSKALRANEHRVSVVAYIGLGSNVGNKIGNIERAVALLDEDRDIRVVRRSQLYKTEPWGKIDQDWFVNACIEVATGLPAHSLLERCITVEQRLGRVRGIKWGPRIIDLDLLTYGDAVINSPDLIVPHPHIAERAFVLVPLADIAASVKIGSTPIGALLAAVDRRGVEPLKCWPPGSASGAKVSFQAPRQ
jgi:2-amino-4-hydroxy-6-hydroxymethyldihydropteridine diphosphokinase